VFTTMRRKRRSTKMRNELGQSMDHFRRAATLAAQETSATVGPRFTAARGRMQPAVSQAKGAASTGWDSALATITPLLTAAVESVRHAGVETKKSAKASKKNARKLERRTNKALGREQTGRRANRLVGLGLVGAALGAGVAFMLRRRKAAQWDEYDPSAPIKSTTEQVSGADDAAFEPNSSTFESASSPAATADLDPTLTVDRTDQTSSAQHSPNVARMAGGQNKD